MMLMLIFMLILMLSFWIMFKPQMSLAMSKRWDVGIERKITYISSVFAERQLVFFHHHSDETGVAKPEGLEVISRRLLRESVSDDSTPCGPTQTPPGINFQSAID